MLFLLGGIAMIGCNKENVTSNSSKVTEVLNKNKTLEFSSPQSYDLQNAFEIHNMIMDNLLNGEYDGLSNNEFVDMVIKTVEMKENIDLSLEEEKFVYDMHRELLNVPVSDMIDLSIKRGYFSNEVGKVINEINDHMENVYYANYADAKRDIDYLQEKLINRNKKLSLSDRNLLSVLIKTMDNSANHYKSFYSDDLKRRKRKCGKCIRNHIGQILLADGVGSVQGLVGCLIFPPSCAALIPTLMSIGSGGAMIVRCRKECF